MPSKEKIKFFIPSVSATPTHMLRICVNSAFSFAYAGAKEKANKKKSAEIRFRALRSATRTPRPRPRKPLKRLDLNFCRGGRKLSRGRQKLHHMHPKPTKKRKPRHPAASAFFGGDILSRSKVSAKYRISCHISCFFVVLSCYRT